MSEITNTANEHSPGRTRVDRRGFVRRTGALGATPMVAGALLQRAGAQDASPAASPAVTDGASPEATGEVITSITRAEFFAQLISHFDLEEPQSTGGQVIETNTTDISTLNPVLATDTYSSQIINLLFDGLVGTSPIDGTVVPSGIADYWEIAPDGVTYTFHLVPYATWHDGTPVTADDVIFTYDGVLAEESLSVRKGTVETALESYRKIDDLTVEFVAKQQSAVFLNDAINQFNILPKHIWEDIPVEEWGSAPGSTGTDPSQVVGNGPFRFVEWVLGSHVTIARNDDFWDPENMPIIDEYIYNVVADPASALATLQTGSSDMVGVPFGQAKTLQETNPELQILPLDSAAMNYYYLNQDEAATGKFTDTKVRQALHYALDRDIIADTVYDGFAVRADGTQPVLSVAYAPDRINTIYLYDPDKARTLLDEAGWTEGADGIREKDGERLSFEMLHSEGSATYETQIPYMQQAWREIGVEMIPAAVPFPTLLDLTDAGNYEAAVAGFGWGFDGFQGSMFRSTSTPPNGFNKFRYSNEEYDALDAAAQTELDDEKRIDLLIEATNIVNDDAAAGVVVFRQNIYGASPRLHNFLPVGYSGYWWFNYAWVDPR